MSGADDHTAPHIQPSAPPQTSCVTLSTPTEVTASNLPETDEDNPDGCSSSLVSGGRNQTTPGAQSTQCVERGAALSQT